MKFLPPVQFPVFIDAKPATAFVLEEIDHPVHTIFRVAFSDGFEDEFLIEDDGSVYGSGIAAITYAKAIRFDIGHIVGLDPQRFYYNYQDKIDSLLTNVWVVEGDAEDKEVIYKVYYFEYFRFALKRMGNEWTVSHKPAHGKEPDSAMVRKVGFLLDSLLEASR